MKTNELDDIQTQGKPLDDVRNLYVGPVTELVGQIEVDGVPHDAAFRGEVLFYGHADGDRFVVERLRRVALYGTLTGTGGEDPVGVLSLTGPLDQVELEPGSEGSVDGLRLALHYDALSADFEPAHQTKDAVFPQVEQMLARLEWRQASPAGETSARLEVALETYQLLEPVANRVRTVRPAPMPLDFSLAGSGLPREQASWSLQSHCGPPADLYCESGNETVERRLPLKFINLSKVYAGNLENLCNGQIGGVCEVWRNKAALDLTVKTTIVEASSGHKDGFFYLSGTQEYELRTLGYGDTAHVEVYLVDAFVNDHGGGIAYDCGQASAFCILEATRAQNNLYLLAHELGHVLGLDHPGGAGAFPGSLGSIMEPGELNSPVNTEENFRVLTAGAGDLPVNPIVETTDVADCFHPG